MEAAKGTAEVTQNIANVSTVAAESGRTATEIQGAASELAKQAEHLRTSIESFLK